MQLDMRWRWWIVAIGIALASASAAPAEPTAFSEGRLSLAFGFLYGLAMPPMDDPGLVGSLEVARSLDGAITGLEVPAGLFQGTAQILFPGAAPFPPAKEVDLSVSNAAGAFAVAGTGTGAVLGGVMPLHGFHKVCLFFDCSTSDAILTVPLDVIGQGGITSRFVILRVAIAGETWSTGSVTVDQAGGATNMVAGGTTPTSNGGTQIQLVTPLMISTNAVGPDDEDVPPVRGLALLSLIVAPEPAQTGMLVAAIASLLGIGARRRTSNGTTS